jgi:hypothetical protein
MLHHVDHRLSAGPIAELDQALDPQQLLAVVTRQAASAMANPKRLIGRRSRTDSAPMPCACVAEMLGPGRGSALGEPP